MEFIGIYTGIDEERYRSGGEIVHIFDVGGGQQSEKKKWLHCFDKVSAVIFVASLSCYDEMMYEDSETNAMVNAIQFFSEIVNNKNFIKAGIILFLNKKDLFQKKYKLVPITVCAAFAEYEGDVNSYDETTGYIRQVFMECVPSYKQTTYTMTYSHMTCMIDEHKDPGLFEDIKHCVVSGNLAEKGLL